MYCFFLMSLMSIFLFLYFYNQLILTLMSLEFLMLSILMIFSLYMFIMNNLILILYYLVFVVCESVLGLTMLIMLIRSYGNDNMNLVNLIMW
uniref:NADH-ubiquinone oxidoreductase chain 4L n=1 Tax=Torymus sp. ZJUH_2016035 TaxID=2491172 RepID=A0A3Q8UA80_9HYME|nr:NADH dehydrogenase subunit 4L [Torymus sp. ZJUH_2016035]